MAIIRAGGITVPINGGMSPDVVARYLAYTGARILITDHATYRRLRLTGKVLKRVLRERLSRLQPEALPHSALALAA